MSQEQQQQQQQQPDQEFQQLPQMITAWKKVREEITALKEQQRERVVRQKALEEVIMRTMKRHSIGALDLKQSNGRLLYRNRKTKGSLSQKGLLDILTEHMNSEDSAKKAVAFITEKRGTKTSESLAFEKL
jgi:hypothetical protein